MVLLKFYRELIALRKKISSLNVANDGMEVIGFDTEQVLRHAPMARG